MTDKLTIKLSSLITKDSNCFSKVFNPHNNKLSSNKLGILTVKDNFFYKKEVVIINNINVTDNTFTVCPVIEINTKTFCVLCKNVKQKLRIEKKTFFDIRNNVVSFDLIPNNEIIKRSIIINNISYEINGKITSQLY